MGVVGVDGGDYGAFWQISAFMGLGCVCVFGMPGGCEGLFGENGVRAAGRIVAMGGFW